MIKNINNKVHNNAKAHHHESNIEHQMYLTIDYFCEMI